MEKKSLFDIVRDPADRQALIDALSVGISRNSDFADQLEMAIEELGRFEGKEFEGTLYDDESEDDVLDLVLPAFRRAWGKTFATPPTLLKDEKLELFQLLFSPQGFMEYLAETIPKSKGMLETMSELDRGAETVSLIVDNYIARNFRLSRESKDIKQEIKNLRRNLRIEKALRR